MKGGVCHHWDWVDMNLICTLEFYIRMIPLDVSMNTHTFHIVFTALIHCTNITSAMKNKQDK